MVTGPPSFAIGAVISGHLQLIIRFGSLRRRNTSDVLRAWLRAADVVGAGGSDQYC